MNYIIDTIYMKCDLEFLKGILKMDEGEYQKLRILLLVPPWFLRFTRSGRLLRKEQQIEACSV